MKLRYQDLVNAQADRNPCLSGLANFLQSRPYRSSSDITIQCLDYPRQEGMKARECLPYFDTCLADIAFALNEPSRACLRRMIFIEDISPYQIEKLGALLDINPLFFASYISTSFDGLDKAAPPPSMALLPSRLASTDSLHLHYQRVLRLPFQDELVAVRPGFKCSGNVPRSIRELTPLSGKQPGLIRSCCSILLKKLGGQSWICLVLVDPTSANLKVSRRLEASKEDHPDWIDQIPFQGGFEDFGETPGYAQFCSESEDCKRRRQTSTLQRILEYYRQPPPDFDPADPSMLALSYYPLRIVAAEWMVYMLLMNCYVKHYEYSFQRSEYRSVEEDITDLQRWRRRGKQSLHKLHLVRLFLEKQLALPYVACPHPAGNVLLDGTPYTTLLEDFHYLSTQIEHYSRSLELVLPIAATIVQLANTRRSISEAVNVRYLTYIALVFVPLTFVSSLFSMSEGFVPGQGNFWIYMAVAIPLVLVVVTFTIATSVNVRAWWHSFRGGQMKREHSSV